MENMPSLEFGNNLPPINLAKHKITKRIFLKKVIPIKGELKHFNLHIDFINKNGLPSFTDKKIVSFKSLNISTYEMDEPLLEPDLKVIKLTAAAFNEKGEATEFNFILRYSHN